MARGCEGICRGVADELTSELINTSAVASRLPGSIVVARKTNREALAIELSHPPDEILAEMKGLWNIAGIPTLINKLGMRCDCHYDTYLLLRPKSVRKAFTEFVLASPRPSRHRVPAYQRIPFFPEVMLPETYDEGVISTFRAY